MKITAFAASNSQRSINKQLVTYAARLLKNMQVDILDLNDYEMPLFSEDREAALGHPLPAKRFIEKVGDSDALIISFAEHNGSYTAAYKNLFDWSSRINPKVFQGKPLVFLATSPGPGGAASVLASAVNSAPFFDGEVKASLSVPSFYENFDTEAGCLANTELNDRLIETLRRLVVAETDVSSLALDGL